MGKYCDFNLLYAEYQKIDDIIKGLEIETNEPGSMIRDLDKLDSSKDTLQQFKTTHSRNLLNKRFRTWYVSLLQTAKLSGVKPHYNAVVGVDIEADRSMAVRKIVQLWFDNVKMRSKMLKKNGEFKNRILDLIYFICRGQFKNRIKFIKVFSGMSINIVERLDSIDGGIDNVLKIQAEYPKENRQKMGF